MRSADLRPELMGLKRSMHQKASLIQKSSVIILGIDPTEANVKRQLILTQNRIAVIGESVTRV